MRRILLLILLPIALAAHDEKLFDSTVISDVPFNIQGNEFRAIYMKPSNTVLIRYPDGVSDVLGVNGSCSAEWIYRACITDLKFMIRGKQVPDDIREANMNATFKLRLNSSYFYLNRSFTVTDGEIFPGDHILVSYALNNTGRIKLDRYSIQVEHPGLLLNESTCCNQGRLSGYLLNGSGAACEIVLVADTPGEYNISSLLQYSVLGRDMSSSQSREIVVQARPHDTKIEIVNETDAESPNQSQEGPSSPVVYRDAPQRKEEPPQFLLYAGIAAAVLLIALMLFLKAGKKTQLDREIEEIRKQ